MIVHECNQRPDRARGNDDIGIEYQMVSGRFGMEDRPVVRPAVAEVFAGEMVRHGKVLEYGT